jgi:general secretion pathway protein F
VSFTFRYVAVDPRGRKMRGHISAVSPAAVSRDLEERGLFVLDIVDGAHSVRSGRSSAGARHRGVLEATRGLAALLNSGMPLIRALAITGNLSDTGTKPVLESARGLVEGGMPLASALAQHSAHFAPHYVGVVRAGERSGDLAGAFSVLADQLEREEQMRARLVSASIYPLVLVTAGGIAIFVLLFFVLPRFVDLLAGSGAQLPRSTALLLNFSSALQQTWPLLMGLAILATSLLVGSRASVAGRRAGSAALLRLPLLGGLRRNVMGARFARLTGVLLGGGAPLLSALEDAHLSIDDPLAREEVARIRARVREGVSLHRSIAEGDLFPAELAELVAVGEEASRLQEFLLKSAELLERRTERIMLRIVTLLEPAIIIGFGVVVAFVALSLLQAIYGFNADTFR